MALNPLQAALLFALALSSLDLSLCDVVKGKVSCLDCNTHYDFSGIKVGVKCDQVKKLAAADTEDTGSFEVELPSDGAATSATPPNCLAKLLGGPEQLYALKANMISNIIKANEPNSYTISTPLAFSTSCPSAGKCGGATGMPGSSKTIDLPLPREWGFAPSSYYIPFFPIIGIP